MLTTFYQTAPVDFGPGASQEVGKKLQALGGKRILLVCDQGVHQAGLSDRIVENITRQGLYVRVFHGVEPDPRDTLVDGVAEVARQDGIDAVVGLGGGSVMDSAKAVSVLLSNGGKISDYISTPPSKAQAPLVLIPTAAGTGSEVTGIAVITMTEQGAKIGIPSWASLALVDPELTFSVPARIAAEGGMDAFSHAAESYTGKASNPHSELLALRAMELLAANLRSSVLGDKEARSHTLLASTFAGIAFNEALVQVGHAMAHAMGVHLHIPHGAACALVLPSVLEFEAPVIPERVHRIACILEQQDTPMPPVEEVGPRTAALARQFIHDLGILTLKERGFSRASVIACAESAMQDFLQGFSVRKVTLEDVRMLLDQSFGIE